MSERELNFMFQNQVIESRTSTKGLAEGSILSPILFNIYVAEVLDKLSNNTQFASFADDFVVYSTHDDFEVALKEIEISIKNIDNWLREINLELSGEKSHIMAFTNKKEINDTDFQLNVNNKIIKSVKEFKFLGTYLDSKLSWKSHIKYTRENAIKMIQILKAISGISWGAHPTTMLTVYKGLIRSRLDWGSVLPDVP